MSGSLLPLLLILGGLAAPLLPKTVRRAWTLLLPLASFAWLLALPQGAYGRVQLFDLTLTLARLDALSFPFCIVFHLAAILGVIYALHVDDWRQQAASLVYAGAGIGGALAGDLITLFVYWELSAISSVFLVWAGGTERSLRAGVRYLVIQVASGVLLLGGAAFQAVNTGSVDFVRLGLHDAAGVLVFFAFGIKCAFPLMHNWLQDAYPESTPTGTVFLSAFTTKLAVYALARGFPGTEPLIWIGAAMTVFPVFFAVIENDLRRVLAYSLNNQLGFMVVGVGLGTPMALNGTVAHAFAHILYKALLFMSMGAVLHRAGTAKASELGGLYRQMPWTAAFCIVGAASISAFPLFSGFVSKSMVLDAAATGHWTITSIALLFASAGVLHHSGIKIPFHGFFGPDRGLRVKEAPVNMLVAMGITAALCVVIGVWPLISGLTGAGNPFYRLLPHQPVGYAPYTASHVLTTLQLLCFAVLAFAVLHRGRQEAPELRGLNLDFDWMYRRAGRAFWRGVAVPVLGWVAEFQEVAGQKFRSWFLGSPDVDRPPQPISSSAAFLLTLVALLLFVLLGLWPR
jgi:multicomponent Na+:H+ antiporter subunit D